LAGAVMESIEKAAPADIPSIQLDPLCVANDKNYFKNLKASPNLPEYIKTGLKKMYKGI
jgi:hypothetical protein